MSHSSLNPQWSQVLPHVETQYFWVKPPYLILVVDWKKKKRNKKQTKMWHAFYHEHTVCSNLSLHSFCESLSVDLVWHGQVSWNHFQSLYFCLKASLFKSKERVGTLLYWGLGPVWGSTVGIKLSILRYSEGIDRQSTLALFAMRIRMFIQRKKWIFRPQRGKIRKHVCESWWFKHEHGILGPRTWLQCFLQYLLYQQECYLLGSYRNRRQLLKWERTNIGNPTATFQI